MDEMVGQTLDKYKITTLLGAGAMGRVYEAEHIFIRKRCALKILNPEIADDSGFKMRALRESQAAAAINHPNIVDVSDFGEDPNGSPYIVMEYLEGESLGDRLNRESPLPVDLALHIGIEVLRGLDAAHSAGIIHRDMKPDNVFLCIAHDEPYPRIKIVDFGISKVTQSEGDLALTQTGSIMGTPLYMSLEQAEGSKEVDHRTDIYSLGVMLYEMLTGRLPYFGDTFASIIMRMMQNRPETPRSLNPNLPPGLGDVVLRGMAVVVADRYQNARAFRDDLKQTFRSLAVFGNPSLSGVDSEQPAPQGAAPVIDSDPNEEFVVPGAGSKKLVVISALVVLLAIGTVVAVTALRGGEGEKSARDSQDPSTNTMEKLKADTTRPAPPDAGSDRRVELPMARAGGRRRSTTRARAKPRPRVRPLVRTSPAMRRAPIRRRRRRSGFRKRLREDVPF